MLLRLLRVLVCQASRRVERELGLLLERECLQVVRAVDVDDHALFVRVFVLFLAQHAALLHSRERGLPELTLMVKLGRR